MLVHCRYAGLLGIARSFEMHLLSLKEHMSLLCSVHSGNNLDKCRFTCSILSHKRMNLPAPELEMDLVQSLNSGEYFGDTLKFKNQIFRHFNSPFIL